MSRLIYLDNAATSYPKPKNVTKAVFDSFMMCGNPGRSGHGLSLYSARAVYDCREAICSFFGFGFPENIVFTYNTTYALNLAIKGLGENEGEIVISNLEHNSVYRPVYDLAHSAKGITFKTFDATGDDEMVLKNFESALSPQTHLCVITMCSNVTGNILPFKKISEICKKRNIKLIFDAAQLAGLMPIDLSDLYFSAICFAGHKSLYGIMGTGFCIFSKGAEPMPLIFGGTGTMSISPTQDFPLPERLETGTCGVPGIIALHEGLKHISSFGKERISEKCSYLEKRITDGLSQINNVKIYGKSKNKVATVLFNIDGINSEETALKLSEKGICVRAGLHCSPLAHKALGTLDTGAVRVSASHLNSGEDIDNFLDEIRKIAK